MRQNARGYRLREILSKRICVIEISRLSRDAGVSSWKTIVVERAFPDSMAIPIYDDSNFFGDPKPDRGESVDVLTSFANAPGIICTTSSSAHAAGFHRRDFSFHIRGSQPDETGSAVRPGWHSKRDRFHS